MSVKFDKLTGKLVFHDHVALSGDTMTGILTLSGAPTEDLHASTKKYVDDNAVVGGGANVTLSNLGATAINASLISDTDSTDDLGSAAKYWANAYIDKIYLDADSTIINTDIDAWNAHIADNTQAHSDYLLNSGSDIAGAGAGFTWTFDASAGSDPVITFGDGIINVTTGALQVGGSAVLIANQSISLSGDVSGTGATSITTTIGADKVLDSMINWGTGATQVSAADVPIADVGTIITATEVEAALQENRTALDLNTSHRGSNGTDHSYIDQSVVSGATPTFTGTNITAVASITAADESADTTCFPLFATADTGTVAVKTGTNLTFNSSTGLLSATTLAGANTNWDAAYTHIGESGASHTYIDQNVTTTGTPSFTSVDFGASLLATRSLTVDTGGVFNIVLASAVGDDFTVDTDKLVVEGDTGNVGIGTTGPGYKLDVRGDMYLFDGTNAYSKLNRNANVNDAKVQFFTNDVLSFEIGIDSTPLDVFKIGTANNVAEFVMQSDGNVGIGVTDPDTKLEVFNAGNQLKLSFDGTDNAIFAVDTAGVLTITPSGAAVNVAGNITLTGTVDGIDIATDVAANTSHRGLTNNPHTVTTTQLSLENVTNVATDDTAYNATSWDANTDAATKNVIRDKIETMDTAIGLNTAKSTNVSTELSLGTIDSTTVAITSDGGADDVTLPAATTDAAGLLTAALFDEIAANTAKNTNVPTSLSVGTVGINTVSITSDGGADDVTLPAATVAAAGMLTTAKWAEIVANTGKSTNVPTALSAGTVNATTYGITSDGGANDIVLPEATTDVAGLLGADKWDEIVANTLASHGVNDVNTSSAPALGEDDNYVTDAEKTLIGNTSGVNTGDNIDGWIAAGKTFTYAAADAPSFTFTIANFDATTLFSVGMRIKLTQTTDKYFIVTKVVFDDPGSTITVYGGTDYALVDDTISSPYYSTMKAPLDFPVDPIKWTVTKTDTGNRSQASPASGTWYNVGTTNSQLTIPIGAWKVSYSVATWGAITAASGSSYHAISATLSTANNTESDEFSTSMAYIGTLDLTVHIGTMQKSDLYYVLATKDVYYLNARIQSGVGYDTLWFYNTYHGMKIKAVCAYL